MVGMVAQHGDGAVQLLRENHPHQLMWQRHGRERKHKVRRLLERRVQALCAADQEGYIARIQPLE